MNKLKKLLLSFLLVISLAACATTSADVTLTASSTATTNTTGATTAQNAAAAVTPAALAADAGSVPEVLAENKDTHADAAEDSTYDSANVVAITLAGGSISAAGDGVTVDGSTATIIAAGTYSLTGTLDDGQVIVDTNSSETVRLILNGVTLSSSTSAPIYVVQADETILLLAENTRNSVSDAGAYVFADPAESEPNAAIFSNGDLTIAGSGALTVQGNYNDGISSDDGLVIESGTLVVNAVDDGIRGKDYLVIQDGSVTVQAGANGLKSDDEEDAAKGYIAIEGGVVNITSTGDAIQAETDVAISGGELTLVCGGGSSQFVGADASAKGIKGAASVTIDGGTLVIDSADDAIHSNGSIVLNAGTYTLTSGDDGVHADASLEINGGEYHILESYEGIESAVIALNGGTLHINSSDDGVNVASGQDGSGMGQRPGGPNRNNTDAFAASGDRKLTITGGMLVVNAAGDGLDINGFIEMTDGLVLVNGPTENMNAALDYDGGFSITGGFFLAVGSSGMAQAPGQSSGQNSLLINFDQTQAAGTLVHIQNRAGEDILTFAPSKQYSSVSFSSPSLVTGQAYTVYTGGSSTGSVTDGLYTGGTYTPGTQQADFSVTQVVTLMGRQGRGGPGGFRP